MTIKPFSAFQKLNGLYMKFLPALILPLIFGIFHFGWQVLAIVMISLAGAFIPAILFSHFRKLKLDQSWWITGLLCAFALPTQIPLWAVFLASAFGQAIGKEVFGGFGTNPFNPALTGRVFITLCLPALFAGPWLIPVKPAGGALSWTADTVSGATPLALFRSTGTYPEFMNNLLGFTGGSICETPAILFFLIMIYMLWRKIGQLTYSFSFLSTLLVFGYIGSRLFPSRILSGHLQIVTGGVMACAALYCTDPISSPRTTQGRILSGMLLAFLVIIIRGWSTFPEGIMFSILLVNSFCALLESSSGKKNDASGVQ
jgi:Na+-translocating ferredoxin:NAD+ oxidoreductase RnfD subunit